MRHIIRKTTRPSGPHHVRRYGDLFWERLRPNKIKATWRLNSELDFAESPEFYYGRHRDRCCLKLSQSECRFILRSCTSQATGYCRLSLLDAGRKEVRKQKRFFSGLSTPGGGCTFNMFIDAYTSARQRFAVHGKLTIICLVALDEGYDASGNLNVTGGLSQELNNLFTSEQFSDVTVCAGGQEFKAHKSILAARSSIFGLMFSNELEESKSGRVEFTDISAEVLKEMLKFIYTGKSVLEDQMYHDNDNQGIDQELAIALLQVADKYQLDRLKVICEDALADSLTAESVNKILALSRLYRADSLEYQCIEFINSHTNEFIKKLVGNEIFLKEALASDRTEMEE